MLYQIIFNAKEQSKIIGLENKHTCRHMLAQHTQEGRSKITLLIGTNLALWWLLPQLPQVSMVRADGDICTLTFAGGREIPGCARFRGSGSLSLSSPSFSLSQDQPHSAEPISPQCFNFCFYFFVVVFPPLLKKIF